MKIMDWKESKRTSMRWGGDIKRATKLRGKRVTPSKHLGKTRR